jgi:hypothetical protein
VHIERQEFLLRNETQLGEETRNPQIDIPDKNGVVRAQQDENKNVPQWVTVSDFSLSGNKNSLGYLRDLLKLVHKGFYQLEIATVYCRILQVLCLRFNILLFWKYPI